MRSARLMMIRLGMLAAAILIINFCPLSGFFFRPIWHTFDSRFVSSNVSPIQFNEELWLTENGHTRVAMAKELVMSKALHGMDQAGLVRLLGEPWRTSPKDGSMRWFLAYQAEGLWDEALWLEVSFSASGIVVDAGWGSG